MSKSSNLPEFQMNSLAGLLNLKLRGNSGKYVIPSVGGHVLA